MAPWASQRLPLSLRPATVAGSPAVVVFVGTLAARALGFLYPILIARVFDRAEFALAIFFINTGFFVSELVLTGFPTALTRSIATPAPATGKRTLLLAAVVGGAPLLVASLVLGVLLAARAGAAPGLMAIVVVGLTIDAYYFAVLRGLQLFRLLAAYRISANLAQLAVLGLAAAAGVASLELAVILYALAYVVPIGVIEATRAPTRRLLASRDEVGGVVLRQRVAMLARFAIPALISGTAYGAIMGLDVFFVRLFAPDSLADYGAARALAVPMLLVPFSLAVVLLPRTARAPEHERGRLLVRAVVASAGVSLVAWLAWLVAGPAVIGLVFPPSYAGAIGPLGALIPAVAVVGTHSVLSQWTLGAGRPWHAAICITAGAAVTVAAHFVLTTRYGATGAAASIGLGATTALVLLGATTLRHVPAPAGAEAA